MNGEATLEECEEHSKKQNGEVSQQSGKTEHWEILFYRYAGTSGKGDNQKN